MHWKQIQSSKLWLNFKLQNGDNLLFGNVFRSPISSEENDSALNLVMGKMCSPAVGRFSHICVVGYQFSTDPVVSNSCYPSGNQGG